MALAWLMANPVVTAPIVGVTTSHHLSDALGAAELTLEDGEIELLERDYEPHPVAGFR